jgi:hypothetical protein
MEDALTKIRSRNLQITFPINFQYVHLACGRIYVSYLFIHEFLFVWMYTYKLLIIIPGKDKRYFSYPQCPDRVLVPLSLLSERYRGIFLVG